MHSRSGNAISSYLPNHSHDFDSTAQGTLIMEFGMLSHLTGDMVYYDAAYSALISIWHMRDPDTGLVVCFTGFLRNGFVH